MTANHDHEIALPAEVFRFLLPRPRRITYCIKNFGVCIGFFQKLRTFLPFCCLECGLGNDKHPFFRIFRPVPGLQFLQVSENKALAPGVAHDALHLRVGCVPRHSEARALLVRPPGDGVDLGHEGAGGVLPGKAQGGQLVVDALGHPVAADDHLVPRGHLRGAGRHTGAPPLQPGHHLGVVDQGAQGGHLFAGVQQAACQLDRPVHPKAEAGGLCQTYLHVCVFLCGKISMRGACGFMRGPRLQRRSGRPGRSRPRSGPACWP